MALKIGGNKMDELGELIQRINTRYKAEGVQERPCRLSDVKAFEAKYGVRLPEAYRRYLLEVGDGEPIPLPYGMGGPGQISTNQQYSEMHAHKYVTERLARLDKPFPFTEQWIWEGEEVSEEEQGERWESLYYGNLFLSDEGCGQTWHLIVTGSQRGRIWWFCDMGIQPASPNYDFLTWHDAMMNGVENWWQ